VLLYNRTLLKACGAPVGGAVVDGRTVAGAAIGRVAVGVETESRAAAACTDCASDCCKEPKVDTDDAFGADWVTEADSVYLWSITYTHSTCLV